MTASPYARGLLEGPLREGRAVGHGYAVFGDDVLALTPPGAPRMPNGIECDLKLLTGERLLVGEGALRTARARVTADGVWDPRPERRVRVVVTPDPRLEPARLLGWGPGLTPLGDDILVGRLASGRNGLASTAGTTRLSRVLLARAALGELPEPAHALLEDGDPDPLLRFGSTSGRGIVLGLAEAGEPAGPSFVLELPLPQGPGRFEVSLC
jgi:hypothetical protein